MSHIRRDELFAAAAVLASARTAHELVDAGESDEDVDDCFQFHPGAEEHVHDVPVSTACEPSETDKAPVDRTNGDENTGNHAYGGFLTHTEMKGRK